MSLAVLSVPLNGIVPTDDVSGPPLHPLIGPVDEPRLRRLCLMYSEHLLEKPDEDLDDMVVVLWDEFETLVSRWTVSRALASRNWTAKTIRRITSGRNADLRDYYEYTVSEILSYQRVYVDESGCDKRIGFRRRGWSPRGVTPTKVTQFHRGQRYQILPAYSQDGIILSRVFQGHTDADSFLDFINELLSCHCNPFPGKHSVIIMDNASFHRTEEVKLACERAGVLLIFLPPYSPDKNPIEEWFGQFKAFIKKEWKVYEEDPSLDFRSFLEWGIEELGGRASIAHGHFRHAGVTISEYK